jgi:preprotein translocase subunit SecG
MYQVIIAIHVLLGLGIIGLVMMQQGKGADAGASFGSGSAGSVFGAQGAASFLSRTTAILATLFFITSLSLAVINGHKGPAVDIMSAPATDTLVVPAAPVLPNAPAAGAVAPTGSVEEDVVKPPSMSQTAPKVESAAPEATTAVPAAEVSKEAQPVPAAPGKGDSIEKIEVPKAEPIKAVEEPKAEQAKEHAVKQHKESNKAKAVKHHDKAEKHKKHD